MSYNGKIGKYHHLDPNNMLIKYKVKYWDGSIHNSKPEINLILYLLSDGFLVRSEFNSKTIFNNFNEIYISYEQVDKIEFAQSTDIEASLGKQAYSDKLTNIYITYTDIDNNKMTIRLDMQTRFSLWDNMKECQELINFIRDNKIYKNFKNSSQLEEKYKDNFYSQIELKLKKQYEDPENMLQKLAVVYLGKNYSSKKSVFVANLYFLTDSFVLRDVYIDQSEYTSSIPFISVNYKNIEKFEIVEAFENQPISNWSLEKKNIICITYLDNESEKQTLFLELRSKRTNTAVEYQKLLAFMENNDIFSKFRKSQQEKSASNNDVLFQIEKLAELHKAGVLTDEEFQSKKSELLKKL